MNRRQLIALLSSATLGTRLSAQSAFQTTVQSRLFHRKPKPPAPPLISTAFFGTDTSIAGAKGIYAAHFNPATGQFTAPVLAAACMRPSFFALNRVTFHGQPRTLLYVANEGDAKTSTISSYLVSGGPNPTLTLLNQVPSAGNGPCYISVESTGRAAYAANYGDTVTTFAVQPDGSLSRPVQRIDFHTLGKNGPNATRQDGPHPHSATVSPDNRFLIVNDLGRDSIVIFPIHPDDPSHLGTPHAVESHTPGDGPRHVAFHPNGRWVYGVDELSNEVDHYLWNSTRGSATAEPEALLTHEERLSTLAPDFHGSNTAAEITVGPAGSFIYISNRGENSIAVFAIDSATGALKPVQHISCGGRIPRQFTFDPTGRYLVCGNQGSASVTVFRRDEATGHHTGPIQTLPVESPLFTLFL